MVMKLTRIKEVGSSDILFCVALQPGTERLYVGSSDFNVYALDMAAEQPQREEFAGEGHQSYVTGVALAGSHLVSGSYDGRLIWWDPAERKQVRTVEAHSLWIRRVISTPDGRTIVSVADDMLCKLWDAATGELIRTVTDHEKMTPHHYPSMLYAATISADGKLLATGDKVGHVAIWDLATGHQIAELDAPLLYTWDPKQRRHSIGGIRGLAFSPDSRLLAVGGIGQIGNIDHLGGPARVEVFDWRTGQRLLELEDEQRKGIIQQIAFHPGGKWFLTAGGDHNGFLTVYDAQTGKMLFQDAAPMHVHGFAFDRGFSRLYAVGHGKIAAWNVVDDESPAVAHRPA